MYSIFEQLLQSRHVSTYKVSKDTGISQSIFSAWKSGKSTPKTDKLQKIADYFGVTLDYLNGNTEDPLDRTYYLNVDNARIAQEMFLDSDVRSFYDIKMKMDPEKFKAYMDFLKKQMELEIKKGEVDDI